MWMHDEREAWRAWLVMASRAMMLLALGVASGIASGATASVGNLLTQPPAPMAALSCVADGAVGQSFCQLYRAAAAECADRRSAADIRQCMHARLPSPPPPACPNLPGISAADLAACEAYRTRYAVCTGRVGDSHGACMRAQAPAFVAVEPRVPAPVGTILPVASMVGRPPANLPPLPVPTQGAPAQPVLPAQVPAPPSITPEAVPSAPR